MAKPTTRQELKDYAYRQLGAPVLDINIDDDQADDLMDDAIQFFNERHYNGVEKMYLKYQITQSDIDRARSNTETNRTVGITTYTFQEGNNYIEIPDSVIGIEKIFKFDSNTISGNMFSIKYQLFLNDIYYWGSSELLTYAMTKTYLEDIDFLLSTEKQIRFNQRMDRLYLDIDDTMLTEELYLIIQCYRALEPDTFTQTYNDPFVKQYATAKIKRQWGQNLIKFQGVKLPGGLEMNGRQIYDDAEREIENIRGRLISEYELPPLDFIG